jgi:archaellum component FlaC
MSSKRKNILEEKGIKSRKKKRVEINIEIEIEIDNKDFIENVYDSISFLDTSFKNIKEPLKKYIEEATDIIENLENRVKKLESNVEEIKSILLCKQKNIYKN